MDADCETIAAKAGPFADVTEKIIGAAFKVSNALGAGFLEKVYENALAYELTQTGMQVEQQRPIDVFYENTIVGKYFADLLVDANVIVEVKATSGLGEANLAQCLNYLKATKLRVGLVLNFGTPRLQIKRVVR
jgi:GxxExxY protein